MRKVFVERRSYMAIVDIEVEAESLEEALEMADRGDFYENTIDYYWYDTINPMKEQQ